ncbi:MAG TPA: CPBP family intramembrane glutamic endopeptidase [Chitinophagaceae bacterium]|nr:CPBP family intramembrane glutamic endopeptidase [Chitinophagaceae bacterium]
MMEYQSSKVSPGAALAILLGLFVAGLFIGSLAGFAVWFAMTHKGIFTLEKDMLNPLYTNAARAMQIVSVFITFFVPSVAVARIMSRSPFQWLGYKEGFNSKQFILVIVIMAACMPLVGALGELNQLIPLSRGLEAAVKKMEDNYNSEAQALAVMHSFGEFIFSLFVMALLPAVFEETFFRGGLQQILIAWFKKPMLAIVVTSIIFSAVHVSWYGFLPRLALGFVLGLFFYYSRSLWLNMAAHFLNNALAVGYMYYLSVHNKPVKDAIDDSSYPLWVGIPAIIAVVLLFRFFQKISFKRSISKIPPMDGPSFESTLV